MVNAWVSDSYLLFFEDYSMLMALPDCLWVYVRSSYDPQLPRITRVQRGGTVAWKNKRWTVYTVSGKPSLSAW